MKNDTWEHVCGEKKRPVVTGEGKTRAALQYAYEKWLIEDRNAKSDLILSMSAPELKNVRQCQTTKEV